jgi:hypothetical protein
MYVGQRYHAHWKARRYDKAKGGKHSKHWHFGDPHLRQESGPTFLHQPQRTLGPRPELDLHPGAKPLLSQALSVDWTANFCAHKLRKIPLAIATFEKARSRAKRIANP